jgi:transcriptional regulator with XRE-family HTH domain
MTTNDDIDLHRLDLRFAPARLMVPCAVNALARSIEQHGQLIPCIAVSTADTATHSAELILIDGYRRIEALRRLGRDTARIETWSCPLSEGLLSFFARTGQRTLDAIEEGLLLRELIQGLGLSQREVARQTGRDVSWVSRRLDLVCGLPDPLLQAVREGTLSPWAATRILAPLARANTDHASAVLDALKATPLSTRELALWFEHYQRSPRSVRDRLVAQPRLFIESLAAANEIRADRHVRAGPEAQWERDLRHLQALIGRLHPALPQMRESHEFTERLCRLRTVLARFQNDLTRSLDHDPDRDSRSRPHLACAETQSARHQPCAEVIA